MIKPGKSSFRWILLSRILLLTVPVLLVGQYVTYRKARSSLLETARQNLTESAGRQTAALENSLQGIKSSLAIASESYVLRSGDSSNYQEFIEGLDKRLSTQVDCVQLSDLRTNRVVASNCGAEAIKSFAANLWPQKQQQLTKDNLVDVSYLWPGGIGENSSQTQISLALSVPVYAIASESSEELQLRYALSVRWQFPLEKNSIKGSLTGSTVVIDQGRTILAHPNSQKVGRNIKEEEDASRLEAIIKNALAGNQNFIHLLFSIETNKLEQREAEKKNKNLLTVIGRKLNNLKKYVSKGLSLKLSEENELLAGYAATNNPIGTGTENNNRWVILAVTPLEYALSGLEEIQQVLLNLIVGLIGASIIAAIFLARTLSNPLEKLRDYAVSVNDFNSPKQAPKNIRISEFEELAEALNKMVERLKGWAKELEKASREANIANELKSEFLENISHNLRTPLNGMLNSLRFVLDDMCDDREEEMEWVQQGHDSAMNLLSIVDDILDLRKIEQGQMSIQLENTNLTEVLLEAIASEEETIAQKGLKLHKPSMEKAIVVYADRRELKQVFSKVLSNAIKFTEEGSITISVKVAPPETDANYADASYKEWQENNNGRKSDRVIVEIEDTGIGIDMTSPENKGRIFEAFQLIDGGKTKKFEGVGLGLAISQHLMEMMNGTINLDSEGVGKGTKVTLVLPVKELPPSTNGNSTAVEVSKETAVESTVGN